MNGSMPTRRTGASSHAPSDFQRQFPQLLSRIPVIFRIASTLMVLTSFMLTIAAPVTAAEAQIPNRDRMLDINAARPDGPYESEYRE